ncbi:hypothetical protein [Chlorobium sp. KB01]|uniref:hypothetical protein n=1 Tax=Chlorobium sp. KB01 TaxID=1917528 RepID=UPI001186B19E|nr:hypothetical protein [Chlorobium sp. KB01]
MQSKKTPCRKEGFGYFFLHRKKEAIQTGTPEIPICNETTIHDACQVRSLPSAGMTKSRTNGDKQNSNKSKSKENRRKTLTSALNPARFERHFFHQNQ